MQRSDISWFIMMTSTMFVTIRFPWSLSTVGMLIIRHEPHRHHRNHQIQQWIVNTSHQNASFRACHAQSRIPQRFASRLIAFAISAIQVNILETEIPVSIGFDRNSHRSSHVVTTNRSEQSTGYNIGATKLRCKHEIPKGGDEWRRFPGGRENLHAGWPST